MPFPSDDSKIESQAEMVQESNLSTPIKCSACGVTISSDSFCKKHTSGSDIHANNDQASEQSSSNDDNQFDIQYNNQHGVIRFTPKNPMTATQHGQIFGSSNLEDYTFENIHLTPEEKADVIHKINTTLDNAYHELAEKFDLTYALTKNENGQITYQFANPDGSALTAEQDHSIRNNLSNVFNKHSAKLGGNFRIYMVAATPKKELEVENPLNNTPRIAPKGGSSAKKEEEEEELKNNNSSTYVRPTPFRKAPF